MFEKSSSSRLIFRYINTIIFILYYTFFFSDAAPMSYYGNIPNLDMNGSNGESYNDHLRVENRERSGRRTRALHVKTHPNSLYIMSYIAEMLKRQSIYIYILQEVITDIVKPICVCNIILYFTVLAVVVGKQINRIQHSIYVIIIIIYYYNIVVSSIINYCRINYTPDYCGGATIPRINFYYSFARIITILYTSTVF